MGNGTGARHRTPAPSIDYFWDTPTFGATPSPPSAALWPLPGPGGGADLSAPAQDSILLMRMTWKGCRRTRMWKPSFPQLFTMYLLAQIRAASSAGGGKKWRGGGVSRQGGTLLPPISPSSPGRTLRAELLVLVRHHVPAERELVHLRLLAAQVEDPDLGVWGGGKQGTGVRGVSGAAPPRARTPCDRLKSRGTPRVTEHSPGPSTPPCPGAPLED